MLTELPLFLNKNTNSGHFQIIASHFFYLQIFSSEPTSEITTLETTTQFTGNKIHFVIKRIN